MTIKYHTELEERPAELSERSKKLQASSSSLPHPLSQLRADELRKTRELISQSHNHCLLQFRTICLEEPAKAELLPFLEAEQVGGSLKHVSRPRRIARVQYDVIQADKSHDFTEALVDITDEKIVWCEKVHKLSQPSFTPEEFKAFQEACVASKMYQDAIAEFDIPEGFVVTIDPWPYGGTEMDDELPRYTQGLCFARDERHKNEDSNHYGYPIPIIPVLDTYKEEIIRIDRLATGGKDDGLAYGTHKRNVLAHCAPSEYIPELLDEPMRGDLKPLNVIQPEGPSFKVTDESLIEWQKWRLRVGFTPREGAVIHDVTYDGRNVLYRMSMSEMTVPYGDPRPPFHRKQAFDFGDGGAGRSANNLELGCDCLGVIKYLDGMLCTPSGEASVSKNAVCIHEQDNGIGWKHTNFRTDRAVVTRSRELVVQFIITLANYEYVFAYKFDQAGGITVETRATGVVSVVNIDPGKTSPYGNVVGPGVLAQNHQHIFCLRIDPSVDGALNTVFTEESLPIPMNPATNPYGNGYEVRSTPILKPCYLDASPQTNLNIKMSNVAHKNPISQKPVSYKFIPSATQLLLADPNSTVARRARFATHHVWVTKYRDGELWAAGPYTNQSCEEKGGVHDAIARGEDLNPEGDDVVVWSCFGLTHNPRVEDWPVMPVEKHELHIKPADFFTKNPALDVPGNRNLSSVLVQNGTVKAAGNGACCNGNSSRSGAVQQDAATHWQGGAEGDMIPVKKD